MSQTDDIFLLLNALPLATEIFAEHRLSDMKQQFIRPKRPVEASIEAATKRSNHSTLSRDPRDSRMQSAAADWVVAIGTSVLAAVAVFQEILRPGAHRRSGAEKSSSPLV